MLVLAFLANLKLVCASCSAMGLSHDISVYMYSKDQVVAESMVRSKKA